MIIQNYHFSMLLSYKEWVLSPTRKVDGLIGCKKDFEVIWSRWKKTNLTGWKLMLCLILQTLKTFCGIWSAKAFEISCDIVLI